MTKKNVLEPGPSGLIQHDHNHDGIDRRGFLKCMAWAGTGALCMIEGGVLSSQALGAQTSSGMKPHRMGELTFVQISDSHMGFNKPANPDVISTLKAAVDKINALPHQPEFLLHTGDITHLSKPEEFDTVDQILKGTNKEVFFVPGEHDVLNDEGASFRERYAKNSKGQGWYSFNKRGVHFIALVNVMNLKAGGLGTIGQEQLAWLADDLRHVKHSTPVVVFAHIPLWTVYPQWGWATDDSAQALGYLKRFGSVTVLNGHIHQTMQKVEGNVTFHTAFSTAFPQPAPGQGDGPGPMKVPAERLRSVLGITDVNYVQRRHALALVDSSLAQV
jgi:3',5'-cyclic-AMP phosphodiesterase